MDQTKLASTNTNIIKHGFLKFQNVYTDKFTSVFTRTVETAAIQRIGKIACSEFGFKSLGTVQAKKADNLRAQFSSNSEYLDYVNKHSINGLECSGSELTIKDCRATPTDSVNTDLYELEIECVCKLNLKNLRKFLSNAFGILKFCLR